MELVITVLKRRLMQDKAGWFRNMWEILDGKFNLKYLAERLEFESQVIDEYVGDIAKIPNVPANLISIITPVYGIKLKYVRKFIHSVQIQTYQNWELCICIDGDPDMRVKHFLARLNKKYPERIRLISHIKNKGICAATKNALTLAHGNIVTFVDADDILHRDALAALIRAFTSDSEVDLVYTNHDILTPWGYRIDPLYKPSWSPELLLSCNYIVHLVAVRRDLLACCDNLWSDKLNGTQDWNLLLRAGKKARRVFHIPIILYHWRAHEHSMSATALSKPWAWDAATVLMEDYISELDHRLYWDWNDAPEPAPIKFRNQEAPPLFIIEIYQTKQKKQLDVDCQENQYTYPGEVKIKPVYIIGDSLERRAGYLDQVISEIPVEGAMLLFVCVQLEDAELVGPLDTLAAYGVLPSVVCAWPFYDEWRGIYTVCDDFLSPRLRQASFYTPWSGNVLTGPLHGLMTTRAAWVQLGGFKACISDKIPASQPIHALGALFGLRALENGLRNVAVRTVKSAWRAPVIDLGEHMPKYDPYL